MRPAVKIGYIRHFFQVIQIGVADIAVAGKIRQAKVSALVVISKPEVKTDILYLPAANTVFAPAPGIIGKIARPIVIKIVEIHFLYRGRQIDFKIFQRIFQQKRFDAGNFQIDFGFLAAEVEVGIADFEFVQAAADRSFQQKRGNIVIIGGILIKHDIAAAAFKLKINFFKSGINAFHYVVFIFNYLIEINNRCHPAADGKIYLIKTVGGIFIQKRFCQRIGNQIRKIKLKSQLIVKHAVFGFDPDGSHLIVQFHQGADIH